MKRLSFILILLFGTGVSARDFVETPMGGGLMLTVPAESVAKARSSFELISKNIIKCQDTFVEYFDPVIDRKNTLIINKNRSGVCQVTWIKDEIWQYTCQAPSLSRKMWLNIFDTRIEEQRFFGDFSENEQELLFDDKTCLAERQR